MRTAWRAEHPHEELPAGGQCARCADGAAAIPVSAVVSRKFTAWDTWMAPHADLLCPPCAWSYRTPALRAQALLVVCDRDSPSSTALDPDGLRQALGSPVPSRATISLPLRAGRKHVLPAARLGQVCVDGTNISWSPGDAQRLAVVADLRGAGAPARAFHDPAPPWGVLSRSKDPARVLSCWDQLEPWRASQVWLEVALAATHPAAKTRATA